MTYVVTLITDPAGPVIDHEILQKVSGVLPGWPQTVWLDEGIAADIFFETASTPQAADQIRDMLAGAPIDFILQRTVCRRKKLLVADMDSTIIEQECLDELADFAGLRNHVAKITARAMRGEIAFEPALRERVALLKGLDAGIIDKVIAERITLTPGATTLVHTMRAHGAVTVLVSGGFTAFTHRIAAAAGFEADAANVIGMANGKLTGLIDAPILGRAGKRHVLENFCERLGIPRETTLAVGDGANDLDMLATAGLGVAFRAKPAVAAGAHARIDHADLTALLYAQGYCRTDFSV